MRRKITLYSIILLFLISNLYSIDIHISKLQGFYKARSEADVLSKKVEFISTQLKKELIRQSSDIITYIDISGLAKQRRKEYDAEPVTDTLDALAICFFYNIDFVLFGDLYLGGDEDQYKSQIKIYSKKTGDIVHTIEYSKTVENDITYAKELANAINQELMVKFAGYSEDDVIAEGKEDKRILDKLKDNKTNDSTEISDRIEGVDTIPEPGERIFGFYLSLGYYFQFSGEWKDSIMPSVTLEQGVNWSIRLVDNEFFDFYIRPFILVDYSFSVQDPYNTYHRYIHYHSLAFKVNLDCLFEFNDIFGFFIGFGPHYRFDIIDYRTYSNSFYTDIPYALGLCVNAGVEFNLNKEGSFKIGLNSIFDITFFDSLYTDLKVLSYVIFKI
ncbi:MAG: hypothetical protein JXB88_06400 [Spirochaetales bacterium]|nr:hypothetical protein [Spirochaetales bacterium]